MILNKKCKNKDLIARANMHLIYLMLSQRLNAGKQLTAFSCLVKEKQFLLSIFFSLVDDVIDIRTFKKKKIMKHFGIF